MSTDKNKCRVEDVCHREKPFIPLNKMFLPVAVSFVVFGIFRFDVECTKEPKETWGYSTVRPGAHMFWWLYYTTASEKYTKFPLIVWLQGGPGASSTGIGNFIEVGPLDVDQKPREFSWIKSANLLFVDNPVGTGFSYVSNKTLLATNNSQIADDFTKMMIDFFSRMPDLASAPMYIFSESYGGKMAVDIAIKIGQMMKQIKLKCSFKGIALIDSWISPIDSVLSWGPFLYSTSLIDMNGLTSINRAAKKVQKAITNNSFEEATQLWSDTETLISNLTNGISFYNIFEQEKSDDLLSKSNDAKLKMLFHRHVSSLSSGKLATLMNGEVRTKLRIVPNNVTWGGQSSDVFSALAGDFMKPVVDSVSLILKDGSLSVSVLTGQLDLIVDTLGTMKWINDLKWIGIPYWTKSSRIPIERRNTTAAFTKAFKTFSVYWVLKAGHMIPKDASETALSIMEMITKPKV